MGCLCCRQFAQLDQKAGLESKVALRRPKPPRDNGKLARSQKMSAGDFQKSAEASSERCVIVRCETSGELWVDDSECVVGSNNARGVTKHTEDLGWKGPLQQLIVRLRQSRQLRTDELRVAQRSSWRNVGSPFQTMASGSLTLATACNTSMPPRRRAKSACCKNPHIVLTRRDRPS